MSDKIVKAETVVQQAEELPDDTPKLETGQWFWVDENSDEEETWFGCIVTLGSNYAKVETVHGGSARIHFNEFDKRCRFEPDPDAYIDGRIQHYQGEVKQLMGEVKALTARLGVAPSAELTSGNETAALAKVNAGQNFDSYSTDLVKAKDKDLPALFAQIGEANKGLANWMTAKVIPLKAQAEGMRGVIDKIEERIFSVELYAGLTERVALIKDGEPAPLATKIHLLQRRCYMDEECIARYETGGMEFADLPAFYKWLVRPDNLERLLPFERCIVSFRVRRETKDREIRTIADFFNVQDLEQADLATFLFIRNGEKVYVMRTKLEFGEKLFPDLDKAQLNSGKLWAETAWGKVGKIISDNECQGMKEEFQQEVAEYKVRKKAWDTALKSPEAKARAKKRGLKEPDGSCVDVPWPGHGWHDDPTKKYTQVNPSNVFYDDIMGKIQADISHHNRIGLILQGLLDRSPVLHPHPPWQIWTAEGFNTALELVYDESRALVAGPKPDFEAYRKRLNAQIKPGSVTVGQEDAWLLYEGDKESKRLQADYNYNGNWFPERHSPHGNPGPGLLAKVFSFTKKSGRCTFAWERERANSWKDPDKSTHIRTIFSCSSGSLLNVSAYTPGDFRQFFDDPRTRQEYLKWAPLLLEAEEYHAGNREVAEPVEAKPKVRSSSEGRRRYQQRKLRKELMGKAVRLVRPVTMQSGSVYEKDTLWRITGGKGDEFSIAGLNDDGTPEWKRIINGVVRRDFEIEESIPAIEIED